MILLVKVNLIDDTIINNIYFGTQDKYYDEKKLKNILELSQVNQIIRDHDVNLESSVGEDGKALSGGQVQRIGIARSLIKDPKLIIFDESVNALDKNKVDIFVNNLNILKDKKIIFLVSHDQSLLNICDKIIKID